jgi:hypothetical protein
MVEFTRLVTLSFTLENHASQDLNRNFIGSLPVCETLPSLKKLIVEGKM